MPAYQRAGYACVPPPSSAPTSPERTASRATSARRSGRGMSSRPNRRASRSSSWVTTLDLDPRRLRDLEVRVRVEAVAVGEQRPAERAQDALLLLGEARRGGQLGLDHRRPRAVDAGLVEAHDRAADLHQVAVREPAPPGEPQAVDPRAVLRPAVVADRPLAGAVGQLGVQARRLRIPRQRDVGLEATADRDRVGRGLEVEDPLAAVTVAEQRETAARAPARPGALRVLPVSGYRASR